MESQGIYASATDSQFHRDQNADQGLTLCPVSQSFSCGLLSQTLLAQDAASSNTASGSMGAAAYQSTGCSDLGGGAGVGGKVRVREHEFGGVDERPIKRPRLSGGLAKPISASAMAAAAASVEGGGGSGEWVEDDCGGSVESQYTSITTGADLREADQLLRGTDSQRCFGLAPAGQMDGVAGFGQYVNEGDEAHSVKDGVLKDVWAGAGPASGLSTLGDIEAQTQANRPLGNIFTGDATCAPAEMNNHQMARTQSHTTSPSASSPLSRPGYNPFHTFSVAQTHTKRGEPAQPRSAEGDQLSGFSVEGHISFSSAALRACPPSSAQGCASIYASHQGNGDATAKVQPRQSAKQTRQHVVPTSMISSTWGISATASGSPAFSSTTMAATSALDHSRCPDLDSVAPNNSTPCHQNPGERLGEPNNGPVVPSPLPHGRQPMLNLTPNGAVNGFPVQPPTPPSSSRLTSSCINSPSQLTAIPSLHTGTATSIVPTSSLPINEPTPSSRVSAPCYNQEIFPHQLPQFIPTTVYKRLFKNFQSVLAQLRWYKVANVTLGQKASDLEREVGKEKEKNRKCKAERDKYRTACSEWLSIVPVTGKSMAETIRLELAAKARELVAVTTDKESAIHALKVEADKCRELGAQLEAKDKEIEQLKLALAQASNCTGESAQGPASGGVNSVAGTQNRLAGKGDITPRGHLILPGTDHCAITAHPLAANGSEPTGVSSTQKRLPEKGGIPPGGRLLLPGNDQKAATHPPVASSSRQTGVASTQNRLPEKGGIPPGGRLILPGDSALTLPGGGQKAATTRLPATQNRLLGKGNTSSKGRPIRQSVTTPPAAVPSHVAAPPSTTTPRPATKPRRPAAKSRPTATPAAASKQPAAPNNKYCAPKQAQITRNQATPPTQRSSPVTASIDLTTPPSSPVNPMKRKREYDWMPSKKVPKPVPYPSARRLSREASAAVGTITVEDDGPVLREDNGEWAGLEEELEREMMTRSGGEEVEREMVCRGDEEVAAEPQEQWAGWTEELGKKFEAELDREFDAMEGGETEEEVNPVLDDLFGGEL